MWGLAGNEDNRSLATPEEASSVVFSVLLIDWIIMGPAWYLLRRQCAMMVESVSVPAD